MLVMSGQGLLLQKDAQATDHPVCYSSTKFDGHQRKYSAIEKETLALLLSLKCFDIQLNYTVALVKIYAYHNSLIFINWMKSSNQRLICWCLTLQEYTSRYTILNPNSPR